MTAILFDFDGTIADTAPCIVATMQHTFRDLGLIVPTYDQVKETIGLPLVQAIKNLGNLTDSEAQEGCRIYREIFNQYRKSHITLFEGVADTIKELGKRGVRMAICTSRNEDSLLLILEEHGIKDFFECWVTNNDGLPPKPNPDMVLWLLEKMNLDKGEAIVVGDTTYDVTMGNRAGCRTIAVTYGNHDREMLSTAEPTAYVDHFSKLLERIELREARKK